MTALAIVLFVLCLAFFIILVYRGYLKSEQEKSEEIQRQIRVALGLKEGENATKKSHKTNS